MKGLLLAGGTGSRLYPLTKAVNKQLLPVYDKPMVYYPLSLLMHANIRDILVIVTRRDKALYEELLKRGADVGCNIELAVQEEAGGIAQALLIAEDFINGDNVMLILGDNIFYEGNIENNIASIASDFTSGALVFASPVAIPSKYGVIEFKGDEIITIEEKPKIPKSNWAIPGLYIYDGLVSNIAKKLNPSDRNELEITDVNRHYLENNELRCIKLSGEWYDAGDCDNLLACAHAIKTHFDRTGINVGCIEEIAYKKGWISEAVLQRSIAHYKSSYAAYLKRFLTKK